MLARAARRATKLGRLLTFTAGRHGLRYGVGAAIEHRQALTGLDIGTIVDVGANKGQFALLAAEVFPDATVYCFEPLEEPAARLRKMLGTGVTLFETAIGRSESHGVIHVSRRANSSSLLPIAKQSEVFPGTELREKRVVSVAPLTKYLSAENLKQPALLKIDVQGYELEVLKGCAELLFVFQYIYLECSFVELYHGQSLAGDVILYLLRRNLQLSGVYNQVDDSNRRPVQADFLFSNADCSGNHGGGAGADVHGTAARGDALDGRAMAKAIGISPGSVQRIRRAHNCSHTAYAPLNARAIPAFATKPTDFLGPLYVDLPVQAVVLSIDEKGQTQGSTAPNLGLPTKPGRCLSSTSPPPRPVAQRRQKFFSKMTRQRIRRSVFRSIPDLQAAINAYLAEHNASPKPFLGTQSAEAILAKLDRLPVTAAYSVH